MSADLLHVARLRRAAEAYRRRARTCMGHRKREVLAIADWLDSAARDAEEIGPDPFAVRTARAILREDPS